MMPDFRHWIDASQTLIETSRVLYHSSEQPFDVAHPHPFTHFGNRKAALRRIQWMVQQRHLDPAHPNHLYGVEFISRHALAFHDAGYNHNWPALEAALRRAASGLAIDYSNPDHAKRLVAAVEQLGYDSLVYRNRAEGGTSYVALGAANIGRVVSDEIITGHEVARLLR